MNPPANLRPRAIIVTLPDPIVRREYCQDCCSHHAVNVPCFDNVDDFGDFDDMKLGAGA